MVFGQNVSKPAIVRLKGALERGSAVEEKASKGGREGWDLSEGSYRVH